MGNWKTEKLTSTYIEGVRGAIPLANEQIEILLRIIQYFKPNVSLFLDLGCGDGILGRTLFSNWPDSKGIFVDYSEPMIEAAKSKCGEYQNQATFIVKDFGSNNWIKSISGNIPVDVVVSGFAIHHQDDNNKQRLYKEIFDKILKPGGVFLNIEQVASPTVEIEKMFDEFFLDHMERFQQNSNSNISIEKIAEEYYKDKDQNILAPVGDQCDWLKEIGFRNVDCYFKTFELAIFGGIKPN